MTTTIIDGLKFETRRKLDSPTLPEVKAALKSNIKSLASSFKEMDGAIRDTERIHDILCLRRAVQVIEQLQPSGPVSPPHRKAVKVARQALLYYIHGLEEQIRKSERRNGVNSRPAVQAFKQEIELIKLALEVFPTK